MILTSYDPDLLGPSFGVDMADVEARPVHDLGVGASFARVAPGGASDPHQHDETEVFVVVRGSGVLVVDGARHEVTRGDVVVFEPFETHVAENPGDEDLVMVDLYWRDADRAAGQATRHPHRRRFDERPVFVFSTPPTPNGDLHLGHLSGPYLGADVHVRALRMGGVRAWHLTGSDDFQSYVVDRARRDGVDPSEVARRHGAEILETLRRMDISVDQYTVTQDEPGYRDGLRRFFSRLVGSGRVAARPADALVDEQGRYLYEVDVAGACPGCAGTTNGNICEECGEPNVCTDLGAPVVKASGAPARTAPRERFMLPLHEFAGEVAEHHHLGRVTARLRELAARVLARPAVDVPLTHPSTWGVEPLPTDLAGTAVHDQVVWVWPEMAYGFLHGIEALGRRLGTGWRADAPNQDWKIVHFFGYDNSFYHAILYPVLYRLAAPGWRPDIDYHPNEFYLLDGSKFSTSRRHAVWGRDVLGPDTVDAVRFHLARTRPEGRRTNFTLADLATTTEDDLRGRWQDWLHALGVRVRDHHAGVAPDAGIWDPEHVAFLGRLAARRDETVAAYGPDAFSLNRVAAALDGLVDDVRRFAREQAPARDLPAWADEGRTAVALELAAARTLAELAAPLLPRFAGRLAAALGDAAPERWSTAPRLVAHGTPVDLLGTDFFPAADRSPETADATEGDGAPGDLGSWVRARVTELLPQGVTLAPGAGLSALGLGSLQAVTLQYRILEHLDVDVPLHELLECESVEAVAALLTDAGAPRTGVPA